MSNCENCDKLTSNMLIAECGYTFVCEDCVEEVWITGAYIDSDGVSTNLWNEYRQ